MRLHWRCYYYFQSLGRFIEDLATAELLADMQTQRLIPLVVEDLHRRSALGPEVPATEWTRIIRM